MEEKKLDVGLGDRLMEARNESLKKMKELTLRPHGKLWGMDVFSWYQPNVNLLSNTLHSFPFPVVWVGNAADINQTIDEDPSVCIQLNSVITFDNPFFSLSLETMTKIDNVGGVNSLEEALILLKSVKKKNSVLLFSASGENWSHKKEIFEEFLNVHQNN